ncbi:DUF4185 domain-containing protein [candidate division KSB1 bacterium]|nr:DUF4185 domain-containing protein [candidate division KSB1 bacterium]
MKINVEPIPEYEAPYRQNQQGWLGGDLVFSLPINENQILWLFGDSFIVSNQAEPLRQNSRIINSSIALQNKKLSEPAALDFFWKEDEKAPKAFFINENHSGFLWPLSAVLMNRKIYVFTVRILMENPELPFSFRVTGNEIGVIENYESAPEKWEINYHPLTWDEKTGTFGSYLLINQHYLYIYGFRKEEPGWDADLKQIVARIAIEDSATMMDMKHWEFLDGTTSSWHQNRDKLVPMFNQANTELSVSFLKGIKKFVLVGYSQKRENYISLRFSETPFGPFSEPTIIYHCPEGQWSPDYFCYAAKAHPELATTENELIISYVTNSKDFHACLKDLRIYFPKFLRVRINGRNT